MNNIAIKINYKQSGISDKNVQFIDQIRTELKDTYILNLRPNSGPQSGGLLDMILEIITNVDLKTFITLLRDGILFDTVTRGKESYLLKPLFDTFSNIEKSTVCWDYSCVSFVFEDTQIYIYGTDSMFTSKIHVVLNNLEKLYSKLKIAEYGYPYQIVAPMEKHNDDNGVYRFEIDEPLKNYSIDDYARYWALSFDLGNVKKIFDLTEGVLLDEDWNLAWYIH